nr:MAG TPA: hypothetical protein [Caudoviricetes sp.]
MPNSQDALSNYGFDFKSKYLINRSCCLRLYSYSLTHFCVLVKPYF